MQQRVIFALSLIVAAAFFIVPQVESRCNVCFDNGIACTSETDFNFCRNGVRDPEMGTFSCPTGTVCTSFSVRCMDPSVSSATPECSGTTGCNTCDGINMFTCTSRTTFAQCNGTAIIPGNVGSCPAGLTCDSSQAEICVSDCRLPETLECVNDAPVQ